MAKGLYKRGNKYKAIRTVVDGITFDSKKEAKRYGELKLLQLAGKIQDLKAHPKYEMPCPHCGHGIPVKYTADFEYREFTGIRQAPVNLVVEDVKSPATITPSYRIRRALMKYCHPEIDFREVM